MFRGETAAAEHHVPKSKHLHIEDHKNIGSSECFEDSSIPNSYIPLAANTSVENIPFIDPAVISASKKQGLVWLVIDNTVYDCTAFLKEHPGGAEVIQSFCGHDVSWQFWRFHDEKTLRVFGTSLRIGVTKGVKNRFAEPQRFIGLRKFWESES